MEHILQFGINIDDEYIKKLVLSKAEKAIVEDIEREALKSLFETDYYGKRNGRPTGYLDEKIDEIIKSHEEEIVQLAVERIANKVLSRKIFKAAMIDRIGIDG